MQFFRNISKSRIVIVATGAFALAMVGMGLESSILAPLRQPVSITDSKAQTKFNNLISAHYEKHGTEPNQQQLLAYQSRAVQSAQTQASILQFFKKQSFELSTKQLLKYANQHTQFKPLLSQLDTLDASKRKMIPAQLEEMKALIEQTVFESTIAGSAIATEENKENMRNIFMQERSYQWLKIDPSYIDHTTLGINNEAEIQQYYETHEFPVPASAKISYIQIPSRHSPKTHISNQEILKKIEAKEIATPRIEKFDIDVYELSKEKTKQHLQAAEVQLHQKQYPVPERYLNQGNIYYKKLQKQSISKIEAEKLGIDSSPAHLYTFVTSKGKDKLIYLTQRNSQNCIDKNCLQQAKQQWIEQLAIQSMNAKIAAIQEQKLFSPKNLQAIAKQHAIKLNLSNTFTVNDKINANFDSTLLKESILGQQTPRLNYISEPIKVESGDAIFYQVNQYTPSKKKPLSEVRDSIISILHKHQLAQKVEADCGHSVKQLHNGEPIEMLEHKFKTTVQTAKQGDEIEKQLPESIIAIAKRIPSSHKGWSKPILHYDADSKAWYLLSLKDVVFTDRNTSAVENIVSDETILNLLQKQEMNSIYKEILS